MPHTLAHYGVQGVASRLVFKDADPKWVLAGCVLPDVPWIVRRVAAGAAPGLDAIDVRVYAIAQASLAGTLVLAAGLALLTRRPRHVFLLLGFHALLHLLLDACEAKWGNGVHLLAPASWELWNFGLFWPESWLVTALGLLGVGWVAWAWRRGLVGPFTTRFRPPREWAAGLMLVAAYFVLPLVWEDAILEADAHSVRTLREGTAGAPVEFDRAGMEGEGRLDTWAGEYEAAGALHATGTVSVRGRLTGPREMFVRELHAHGGLRRDLPTYVGLLVLAYAWIVGMVRGGGGRAP